MTDYPKRFIEVDLANPSHLMPAQQGQVSGQQRWVTEWTGILGAKEGNMSEVSSRFQVGPWLEQLGLGQYAAQFQSNDIDTLETLLALDDQDLIKIGVTSLGHRKKILAALEQMRPVSQQTAAARLPLK